MWYKLTFILSTLLLILSSCGDDKGTGQLNAESYLNGDYKINSDFELVATLNKDTIKNKNAIVEFSSIDNTTAQMVVKNIINGQSAVTFNNIKLINTIDSGLVFRGEQYNIQYSGNIGGSLSGAILRLNLVTK